ncbi:hypothetical protein V4D30_08790 [Thermodesulfovibrio sp. 3907-1M]|uniref:Uncharacterized protein n=1 Tax=Thermodesulfovibrio autotrophicus TaxID=3118333 RepID=A0AAU8GWR3_9BACT
MLLVGIVLILIGYFILFSVPSEATPERIMNQAMTGIGLSIAGAIFLIIHIYKKT